MAVVSELLSSREGRLTLAARDIPAVYRMLIDAGISQHRIARWTRQRQAEIHAIFHGRPVLQVAVLERICDGLGVPRGWMRLAYAEDAASNTAPDDVGTSPEQLEDAMKRRTVLVAASVAVIGKPLSGSGETRELPAPSYAPLDEPLPSRLGRSDVIRLERNNIDDPRAPVPAARLGAMEAWAYAALDRPDLARRELSKAREGWAPPARFEQADMDCVTALVAVRLGQLDAAESFAAASVRRWAEGDRIGLVQADTVLATIHVLAGQPDGLVLARTAIGGVASLRSGLARDRLQPLQLALSRRRDTDSRELARAARHVITTRP